MTRTVLILGPTGRFGRTAAEAFESAGWQVRRFDRKCDTLDDAARGVSVIVNAWNPRYSRWKHEVAAMQPAVHRAALANDATVIIPGNVYVFGVDSAPIWSQDTSHRATNILGRIRAALEQSYRDAGVRTIVLRAGDFLDTEPSGNWFDKIMAPGLRKGTLTYPGKRSDIPHAWAYLPDMARAAVLLAEQADRLERFTDVPFPGYTLSGDQMAQALQAARGHPVQIKPMAWWILRFAQPFMPDVKHFFEMRYLWNKPHQLDGTLFGDLLPDFDHTPVQTALGCAAGFVTMPDNATPKTVTATA